MLFNDLATQVLTAAGLHENIKSCWVKTVTQINPAGKDGYAFDGMYINNGTVELANSRFPALVLACSETGSNKYRTKHYAVLIMNRSGEITPTDLHTDDKKPGWALRLRDPMIKLLAELKTPVEPVEQPALTDVFTSITITEETANRLQALKAAVNETSDDVILATIIEFFMVYLGNLETPAPMAAKIDLI